MESCKIPVMERKQQCPSSHFFPTLPNQEVEKASGDDDTYAPLSGKKSGLSHHDMCVKEWSEGCFCRGDQIVSILFVKIRSDSMPSLKAITTKKALLVQIGLNKKGLNQTKEMVRKPPCWTWPWERPRLVCIAGAYTTRSVKPIVGRHKKVWPWMTCTDHAFSFLYFLPLHLGNRFCFSGKHIF